MEIEKSRNGFYTVTFINKHNLNVNEIHEKFSTVGKVWKVVQNNQRIFIRFKSPKEAIKAISKFGKTYNVEMAKNNGKSKDETFHSDSTSIRSISQKQNLSSPVDSSSTISSMDISSEKFNLILGNLPKNYTVKDVQALVEEAKPITIDSLDETRAFHVKFCQIVLSSIESLNYLIDKLHGFVICGEKLIAVEAKNLLEWQRKRH